MVFGFKFVGGTVYLEYQCFKLVSQILGFISFSETKQCSFLYCPCSTGPILCLETGRALCGPEALMFETTSNRASHSTGRDKALKAPAPGGSPMWLQSPGHE